MSKTDLAKLNELTRAASVLHTRVVTEHKISEVMFGPYTLPVHPQGRVLTGNIRHGEVYLYIEEPTDPAPLVNIVVSGFRDGSKIPPGANYVCSVFERTDHAHIYVLGMSR